MSVELEHPPWHAGLWRYMAGAIAADRVAHGLLVCGAPGVGKRVFADRIVRALLCRSRDANGDACGACAGCRPYAAGTHPDVSRLEPEEAGRQIRVDAVRAFSARLHLTPQYDSGRIGWIDPAEALSISAANSLLKTLEEPPAGCHIVLVTDRVSALMATIRSRCQLWRVPPPAPDTARAWLVAQGVAADSLDADSLRTPFAVRERTGRDYASLADSWDADLAGLLAGRVDAVAMAERSAADPADLWLDWLYRRAAALLAVALGDRSDDALSQPLAEQARRLEPGALQRWVARVAETARRARTNADWRLVVESVLLQLTETPRDRST